MFKLHVVPSLNGRWLVDEQKGPQAAAGYWKGRVWRQVALRFKRVKLATLILIFNVIVCDHSRCHGGRLQRD